MSKAEQRALEAYPKDIEEYIDVNGIKSAVDNNSWQRTLFLKGYQQAEKDLADKAKTSSGWDGFYYGQGYHQAEKDLELTWEDIEAIDQIFTDVFKDGFDVITNNYYKEVLKRFKERKSE